MDLVAPRRVGTCHTRDRTHVLCIGRWILNHWTTREAPIRCFKLPFNGSGNDVLFSAFLESFCILRTLFFVCFLIWILKLVVSMSPCPHPPTHTHMSPAAAPVKGQAGAQVLSIPQKASSSSLLLSIMVIIIIEPVPRGAQSTFWMLQH